MPESGLGSESWDLPVRVCPLWPPELALPPGDVCPGDGVAAAS